MNIYTECTPGGWVSVDLDHLDGPKGYGDSAIAAEQELMDALDEERTFNNTDDLTDTLREIALWAPGAFTRRQAQ